MFNTCKYKLDVKTMCQIMVTYTVKIECHQGRIGPAAPPPLRAVHGPLLNHAFFMNLYVVIHI